MADLIQVRFGFDTVIPFNDENTEGNLLLVLVYSENTVTDPVINCTDSQGNTYIGLGTRANDNNNSIGELFYVLGCKGGANEISASMLDGDSPLTGVRIMAHEFSAVSEFHTNSFASGNGLSQSSGAVSVDAGEFLFGYEFCNLTHGQTQVFNGDGWTQAALFGAVGQNSVSQYRNIETAGDYESTTRAAVAKGGSCHWVEEVAAFIP